jgi:hypothetical protein
MAIHLVSKGMEIILQVFYDVVWLLSSQYNTYKCLELDSNPQPQCSLSPTSQSFVILWLCVPGRPPRFPASAGRQATCRGEQPAERKAVHR